MDSTVFNHLKILVVDDDDYVRELLEEQLRQLGVQHIESTSDGLGAMKMLRNAAFRPDFLFCDVFMPEADGFEVISSLIEMKYQGTIVLLSGASVEMLDILRKIADEGGLKLAGAVMKPVSLDQLSRLLDGSAHT